MNAQTRMTPQSYMAAVNLSTQAGMRSGLTAVELIGVLELVKINIERQAYRQSVAAALGKQQPPQQQDTQTERANEPIQNSNPG